MGEIKLGADKIGKIYLGETQLLGFDWSKLWDNLSYTFPTTHNNSGMCVIANLSSFPITLMRENESRTIVTPGMIDWFSVSFTNPFFSLYNENNVRLRILSMQTSKRSDQTYPLSQMYNGVVEPQMQFYYQAYTFDAFAYVCFLFDA